MNQYYKQQIPSKNYLGKRLKIAPKLQNNHTFIQKVHFRVQNMHFTE